jgi:hypothetical protein
MKNRLKLFGIIAVVAVIGFSMAACDNGTTTTDDTNVGGGGNHSSGDSRISLALNSVRMTRDVLDGRLSFYYNFFVADINSVADLTQEMRDAIVAHAHSMLETLYPMTSSSHGDRHLTVSEYELRDASHAHLDVEVRFTVTRSSPPNDQVGSENGTRQVSGMPSIIPFPLAGWSFRESVNVFVFVEAVHW